MNKLPFYAVDFNNGTTHAVPDKFMDKVLCGDSMELLKELPDDSIDIILTSPPYNFNMEYDSYEDDISWNDYFKWLNSILDECIRVLKYGGRLIVNVQPLFSDYIPTHHIISNYLCSKGMIWKGEILWEKNNYNCKFSAFGSWKSPSMPYLKYTWEFIEVFCKGSLKHKGDSSNIDINADEFKKFIVAKWSMATERRMKDFDHPAMFPEQLVERCLKLFSYKEDIILDPFNGVGTTTYVAKKLGRRYIGFDISKQYCDKANERLDNILKL